MELPELKYEPPYDSPIEDIFASNIIKYFNSYVKLTKQFRVSTFCGNFYIDFVASLNDLKVGFECDGEEFHSPVKDEIRDALILDTKTVDIIYRLRGADLFYHIEDCLFILSKLHPVLFSDRGLTNIETLATDNAKAFSVNAHTFTVIYPQPKPLDPLLVWIEKHTLYTPKGKRNFLVEELEYAKKIGGGSLENIYNQFRNTYRM